MTFEVKRKEYSREHIYIVEIDLDFCALAYGVSPCTASGSGDDKCFNTIASTQDLPNYRLFANAGLLKINVDGTDNTFTLVTDDFIDHGFKVGDKFTSSGFFQAANNGNFEILSISPSNRIFVTATSLVDDIAASKDRRILSTTKSVKTYRFCETRSPHPINLDAIPSLLSVNIAAAQIDLRGGLGVRSSVNLTFKDSPSSDINIDKYVDDRSWIAFERGTFWTKLRARNPNYQFRELRLLSGYLNEDGSYDAANFQTRYFVIDRMNVSNGQCVLTAKDPLKLASSKKAQVPTPNTGQLSSTLASGATSATLIPSGVGNSEYAASGKLLIDKEVMSFTRTNDDLTLTRAQNNTIAAQHEADATIQQCYVKNAQANIIVKDLLENFANINTSFIPTAEWQTEADTFLTGLLDGIIVKPMDVLKVLKELAEAMPHYLWWEERDQEIKFTALKAPPASTNILNMSDNLIADSVRVIDKPEMRVSTVFVNFGQFDPTKNLDEPGNFRQSYVRIDTTSIVSFGSSAIRTINSRWISNSNKAAALQLAALIGRTFSEIPRQISFSLDAKDGDVWVGQSRNIYHRDIVDFTGVPKNTTFKILSSKESDNYSYIGIEYVYGPALDDDEGGGDPDVDLVILGSDQNNINFRTIYNSLFPAPDASTKAKFIVESGVVIGSILTSSASIETGSWPAGAIITLQTDSGSYVIGKGGKGAEGDGTPIATAGGDAINLSYALEIINNGIIGGGGGGGGHDTNTAFGGTGEAAGGGGAGSDNGGAGDNTNLSGSTLITLIPAKNGTIENGGDNGFVSWNPLEPALASAGDGGDLGQAGESKDSAGGAAGKAIDKNGFTLTQTVAGDIRGTIS